MTCAVSVLFIAARAGHGVQTVVSGSDQYSFFSQGWPGGFPIVRLEDVMIVATTGADIAARLDRIFGTSTIKAPRNHHPLRDCAGRFLV